MPHFTSLALSRFRNFPSAALEFAPGLNILQGPNGSGKTNLLEALFLLCVGKSFRHARIRTMVQNGAAEFSDVASFAGPSAGHELRVAGTPDAFAFFLDNERLKSAADLLGTVPVTAFTPEDLQLVAGPPSERRRFLNLLISQREISYFTALCEYGRTLAQRNAWLKTSNPDPALTAVFTEGLIRTGALIRAKRRELIETLKPAADKALKAIRSAETVDLASRPEPVGLDPAQELKEEFSRVERQETFQRTTLFGPHLDDLTVRLNGADARIFASRGQQRSLGLALKLASAGLLEAGSGREGVLLLDDPFSELDEDRSRDLIGALPAGRQVILALPRVPGWLDPAAGRRFAVMAGSVRPADGKG